MLPSVRGTSPSHGIGATAQRGRGTGFAAEAVRVACSSSTAALRNLFVPRFGGGVVDTVGGATATLQADAAVSTTLGGRPAVAMDGTGDFILTNAQPFSPAVFTIIGIARRANTAAGHTLISGVAAGSPRLTLVSATDNVLFHGTGLTSVTWTGPWTGTGAHVFGFEFNDTANTVTLYMDGALVSSQAQTASISSPTTSLEIGMFGAATNPYNGAIGTVATFSGSLTAAEHAQIARGAL